MQNVSFVGKVEWEQYTTMDWIKSLFQNSEKVIKYNNRNLKKGQKEELLKYSNFNSCTFCYNNQDESEMERYMIIPHLKNSNINCDCFSVLNKYYLDLEKWLFI